MNLISVKRCSGDDKGTGLQLMVLYFVCKHCDKEETFYLRI